MIETLQRATKITLIDETFIPDFRDLGIAISGAGNSRPPKAEIEVETESPSPTIKRKAFSSIDDLLLRPELTPSIAGLVTEELYLNNSKTDYQSLISSLNPNYIAPLIDNPVTKVHSVFHNHQPIYRVVLYTPSVISAYTTVRPAMGSSSYVSEIAYEVQETQTDTFYNSSYSFNLFNLDFTQPMLYSGDYSSTEVIPDDSPLMVDYRGKPLFVLPEERQSREPRQPIIDEQETYFFDDTGIDYQLETPTRPIDDYSLLESSSIQSSAVSSFDYQGVHTLSTAPEITQEQTTFPSLDSLAEDARPIYESQDFSLDIVMEDSIVDTHSENYSIESHLEDVEQQYGSEVETELIPIIEFRKPETYKKDEDKDPLERKLRQFERPDINPETGNFIFPKQESRKKENCENTSDCFAEVLNYMDGKETSLSPEKAESISQCYADQINHMKKAREYLKQRGNNYDLGIQNRIDHVGFTQAEKNYFKLESYVRNGEIQEDFGHITRIVVGGDLEGEHYIQATWNSKDKKGVKEKVRFDKDTVYAQLDIGLRQQGYTPIWVIQGYIDTVTGQERTGIYLEGVAEVMNEARLRYGHKDQHGMDIMGIITLVNHVEPGQGTTAMDTYKVTKNDIIDPLIKSDKGRLDYDAPINQAA